jgi:hypothetical protein
VDDSHNTENATHSMELRWRSLREQLESDGAPTAALDHIQTALLDGERPVGASGRGLVATAERIVLDQRSSVRLPHLSRGTRHCPFWFRW